MINLPGQWIGLATWSCIVLAVIAERVLPIHPDQHPLAGWRYLAQAMTQRVNHQTNRSAYQQRLSGLLAMVLLLATLWPFQAAVFWMVDTPWVLQWLTLTLLLCWRPLLQQTHALEQALTHQQQQLAKEQLQPLVVRDTSSLSPLGLRKAALETLIFRHLQHYISVLFWFWVGGITCAFGYRLIALLGEYWNPKQEPFRHFGQSAHQLATILAWLPTRSYLLWLMLWSYSARTRAQRSAITHFPNRCGGWLLAVIGSKLNCHLAGPVRYSQQTLQRCRMQFEREPDAADIPRLIRWLNFCLMTLLFFSGAMIVACNMALWWVRQ